MNQMIKTQNRKCRKEQKKNHLNRNSYLGSLMTGLIGGILAPSIVSAGVLFNGGFETGDISDWYCSGNCATVTSDEPRTGTYAGKFTLTPNDPVSDRTELIPGDGRANLEIGKEYWIGFSNKLVDWQTDNSAELVLQTHTSYNNWDCALGGAEVGRQPISILTGSGNWRVVTGSGHEWSAPYTIGVWNDWVLHIVVSSGDDGLIELWKDGEQVLSSTGQNYPAVDGCGDPMATPFIKVGIYKWDWKESATESNRREIHIDQSHIGEAATDIMM